MSTLPSQFFRHIDGGYYRFITLATSAESLTEQVVYEHVWPFEVSLWVRDRNEFESRFVPVSKGEVEQAKAADRTAAQSTVSATKLARRLQRAG